MRRASVSQSWSGVPMNGTLRNPRPVLAALLLFPYVPAVTLWRLNLQRGRP